LCGRYVHISCFQGSVLIDLIELMGLFGLTYLSLSTCLSTCDTVWRICGNNLWTTYIIYWM